MVREDSDQWVGHNVEEEDHSRHRPGKCDGYAQHVGEKGEDEQLLDDNESHNAHVGEAPARFLESR